MISSSSRFRALLLPVTITAAELYALSVSRSQLVELHWRTQAGVLLTLWHARSKHNSGVTAFVLLNRVASSSMCG